MKNSFDCFNQRKLSLTTELTTKVIHVQCPNHCTAQIILLDIICLEERRTMIFVSPSLFNLLYISYFARFLLQLSADCKDRRCRELIVWHPMFLSSFHKLFEYNSTEKRSSDKQWVNHWWYLVVRHETTFTFESCIGHCWSITSSIGAYT